jgi:hypothetical protein
MLFLVLIEHSQFDPLLLKRIFQRFYFYLQIANKCLHSKHLFLFLLLSIYFLMK